MNSYSLQRTLESILRTREHELTCEEVARLLDRYVDQRLAGAVDDSPEMRLVEEHHQICPESRVVNESIVRAQRNCDLGRQTSAHPAPRPGPGADWAHI